MNTYYKECFLEDIYHFEALDAWKELETGIHVILYLDENDTDCTQKIKVKLDKDEAKDCKVLGVLSEEDSKSMLPFYKSGWKNIFFGKIGLFDKDGQRIKVVIYIRDKAACEKNTVIKWSSSCTHQEFSFGRSDYSGFGSVGGSEEFENQMS